VGIQSYSTATGYGAHSRARANRRLASGRRKQVAMEEKVKTYEAAADAWKDLRGSSARMRANMTQRYGIEF
jgi:hypothetical protein